MRHRVLKKFLIFFIFLAFIFVQNKSNDVDATNSSIEKSNMREFVSGYSEICMENYEWIKDNVFNLQEVVPNDLAIKRLKEEKENTDEISIFTVDESNPAEHSKQLLPSAVDNSVLKSFPPIGDQGSLGSCAAFNTTYYQLTHTIAMEKGWDVKNDSDNIKKFSPKWTFNLTNAGQNSSMSVFDSYRLFMDSGAALWSDFPYINDDSDPQNYLEWPTDAQIWRNALNYRIEDYGKLEVWDEKNSDTPVQTPESESLTQIKQLLNNGHVLVFETNITGWNFDTVGNNPLNNYDSPFEGEHIAYASGKSSMTVDGHVMTIVGYDDDIWVDINGNGKVDPGEKGAFKVANSWGTDEVLEFTNTDFTWYSNEGFVWLAYDALNKVSAVEDSPSVPERRNVWRYNNYAYWITARTDYTPKLLVEYTMNTPDRYNIKKLFGVSNFNTYHPVSIFDPNSINKYPLRSIGELGFDGTSNACDATFVFDLTHLYEMYDNQYLNWYFSIVDEGAGNEGVLKELKFIDLYNEKEYFYEEVIPYNFSNESVDFGPVKIEKDTSNLKECFLNKAMPIDKRSFRTASLNDKIYVIGGYQPSEGYVNTLYEYDSDKDIWESKSELSGETVSLIYATEFDEEIYTVRKIIKDKEPNGEIEGEESEENKKITGIIEKYNPMKDQWTYLKDINYENVRDIITVNNKIYIIEHNELEFEDDENGDESNNVEDAKEIRIQKYNPSSNTITTVLEKDFNWRYFRTVALEDEIYFIGGKRGRDILSGIGEGMGGFNVDNVCMAYNTITKEWKEKTPLHENYTAMDTVTLNDKIYAVTRHQNGVGIMFYHSGTDMWYKSELNLTKRNGIRLAVSKNSIIVLGGRKNVTSFILPDTISDAIEVVEVDSIFKYGDVNGDGVVDSTDYILMQRYVLGIIDEFPSEVGKLAADVNRDGEVNSKDCAQIKKYILYIIDDF
ncbi:dockerin type I domain-containing protein [Herbivorax sp. ANBcel31]|uniref:dockerin type I domain-containing protein n=1 Tax=Herbivorax sp. ANBcel31 TaxID=3069754 RepID=UPI0027B1BA91|nr:dockerin type I domain-containing protein [Herbivorax sp. ANBcel31]MDQ2086640.1 dockerin type I domain-containing protein [Herbivorax sp. ANBcel31]